MNMFSSVALLKRYSNIYFVEKFNFPFVRLLSTMSDKVLISNSNDLFLYEVDRFNGVIVKSDEQLCDEPSFNRKLRSSLEKWSSDGVRAIWFHVSLTHTKWVPILSDYDFVFHRVTDVGQCVVMCRWLPKDTSNHIPPYAHTMVGVGGIVLNSKDELLVVQQRFGSRTMWKLPGGYVEPGEELSTAAIREVEEETGIRTTFKCSILFRHTHAANFNCSDLYFIVQLEPLNEDVNDNNDEVLGARWMRTEEFLHDPTIHDLNKTFLKTYFNYKKNNMAIVKEEGIHPITKKTYSIYFASKESSS